MNGYIHGTNNSSFELDNRFNAIVSILERMAATQQEILFELRALNRSIEGSVSGTDKIPPGWLPPEY